MISHKKAQKAQKKKLLFQISLCGFGAFLWLMIYGPRPANTKVDDATSEDIGLQFRLSHGVAQPERRATTKPATASELSQSEIETVLRRLPPMKVDPAEEFAVRASSLPPPRTAFSKRVLQPATK